MSECRASAVFWSGEEDFDVSCILCEDHDGSHIDECFGEWEEYD